MNTLEQAIASYEKSAERYHKSFLHCKAHGGEFYQEEAKSNKICCEHDRQLAAWLRELQERRKADSCEGCKNIGLWENEYENGLSCPCLRCTRRAEDNYEPERRADE